MRTIKELLELSLKYEYFLIDGLCQLFSTMYEKGLIDASELMFIKHYMRINRPFIKGRECTCFWWPSREIPPRIEWIEEHIKLNS